MTPYLSNTLPSAAFLRNRSDFVLLESGKENYLFTDPEIILKTHNIEEVEPLLEELESYLDQGYCAAGYVAYEAGYAFEPVLRKLVQNVNFIKPLLWMGVYKKFFRSPNPSFLEKEGLRPFYFKNPVFNLQKENYIHKIETIKENIARGKAYQVNFTGQLHFDFSGDTLTFYYEIKKKQPVKHCAYISNEYGKILSFSPELFFRKDSDTLTVRPMKGTIERGRDSTEDRYFSQKLLESEKDRAENVMIVDLLRNDLGRLSLPGSVVVKKLFEIEKYPTLFQMTSTIESKVPATISLSRLFSGLFPCGSITGAPKIESMKIIHKLEENFRGVYTGSIGFITPERDMVFNVAIRTLEIDGNLGKMGIGSGIVWDSDPVSEYRECFLKSRFLTTPATPEFEILETILWANKRYVYREEHLDRMEDSALYFDYRIDRDAMAQTLKEYEQHLTSVPRAKVRVLLKPDGSFTMESHPFFSLPRNGEIALSRTKTDSKDFFLYHKTTNRRFYNEQFQKAQELGFLDVIFLNEQNQLTEGAVHNLFIVKRGEILTPPARCGLLNGIYRKMLLKGFPRIREKALKIEDLRSADRIFLTNSVTGIRKVQWNGEWIQ